MSENDLSKRSRKSAPIKNAMFIGAAFKDRRRLRDVGNEFSSENTTHDEFIKHDNNRSSNRFPVRSRQRNRENMPTVCHRMSTPMGRERSEMRSPGGSTRSTNELNRSLMNLPNVGKRRFHPTYDPYIEIRRARERLQQYKTKGDWAVDMLLSDDADDDLQRYEEKLKRRRSLRGDHNEEQELERRQIELLRRQRDIDTGKVTDRYAEYVLTIAKPERQKYHPRTPNKFRTVSRRSWDGMIKKWRKHLHSFDSPDFNETWRSLSTNASVSSLSDKNSSDCESSASSTWSFKPFSRTEIESPTHLTSDPVVKKDVWGSARTQIVADDEDTLQGAATRASITGLTYKSSAGFASDEDTMHAPDVACRFNLRSRLIKQESDNAPSPDVLHSGLTNDMCSLSNKRMTAEDNMDSLDFKSISNMLSPSKRARRVSGNIALSKEETESSPSCWKTVGKLKKRR